MEKVYLIKETELKDKLSKYQRNIERLVDDEVVVGTLSNKLYNLFKIKQPKKLPKEKNAEYLNRQISDFYGIISYRSRRTLQRLGIQTVKDLTETRENQLLNMRNCGYATIEDIIYKILRPAGLRLKMPEEVVTQDSTFISDK